MKRTVYILWICSMLSECSCEFHTGDVRLVGGNGDHEGRVEIFLNRQWGTVDDDPWDNEDAGVVCRQLGYQFGGQAYTDAHFGQGQGSIWLDDIRCVGNEPDLLSCPHGTDTSEDSHNEDVGVACYGGVRLVDGNGPNEGRVEIFMNGQWGTVDEDPWNDNDADVVCRQLGYPPGGAAFISAHFGQGDGPIWLDDIHCVGNEPNLLSCSHGTDTSEDTHSEDVGVTCAWPVRLANGPVRSQGRVEVFINGQWGTISDYQWDYREAAVVCRQFGYPSGGIAYSGAYFGEGTGPILLERMNCAGTETSLFRCPLHKVISKRSHSEDAGVACFDLTNDLCLSQPCANNGKCVNQITSFLCVCPIGYNGTRCEHANNLCYSQPCFNNGRCIKEMNSFLCVCPTGFNGTRCENALNPCDSHPCEHGGLCIREGNDYRCICPDGAEGRRCENDSDPCGSKDCISSANCVHRLNYRVCTCLGTSRDTILCTYEINPCSSNPCSEKENCLSQGSSFHCVTAETKQSIEFGGIISFISLIMATCAILAATICLVKINTINGTIKQQRHPFSSATNDDHVQMHLQHNKYAPEKGCDKDRLGASCQNTSFDYQSDDGLDIYENFHYR